MTYLKVTHPDESVTAEALQEAVFVCIQERNNLLIRCSEYFAQGILSCNAEKVYMLPDKEPIPGTEENGLAEFIDLQEYESIINNTDSPSEDDSPEEEES